MASYGTQDAPATLPYVSPALLVKRESRNIFAAAKIRDGRYKATGLTRAATSQKSAVASLKSTALHAHKAQQDAAQQNQRRLRHFYSAIDLNQQFSAAMQLSKAPAQKSALSRLPSLCNIRVFEQQNAKKQNSKIQSTRQAGRKSEPRRSSFLEQHALESKIRKIQNASYSRNEREVERILNLREDQQ